MSHAQQPSIRSFFQPRPPVDSTTTTSIVPPPTSASPGVAPPSKLNHSASVSTSSPPPPPPPQHHASPSTPTVALSVSPLPGGVPVLPSPPSLPAQVSIVPVGEQHIAALRRINSLLLPVAYPDSFYAKALEPLASGLFSRAILWQDDGIGRPGAGPRADPKVIGGVICRLEPNPFLDANGQPRAPPPPPRLGTSQQSVPPRLDTPYHAVYIQSLTLLSPYRSQGLAAAALEHIVASAAILPAAGSSINVRTIYAHVWTENEEGLRWYESRGFRREGCEPVRGYYFKLRPDTAWIVRRDIGELGSPLPQRQDPSLSSSPPLQAEIRRTSPSNSNSTLAAAVNLAPMGSVPPPAPTRPSLTSSSASSFQNLRPDMEWNDLPDDMVAGAGPGRSNQLVPPSLPGSGASSRSSSAVRKKKDRSYPTAAFGN
ncbi:hypothetical protein B0H63DRAFT_11699 [Podospora didyma]|uniref:N-acetyltransferase domain-containing protein n=1 Tax=Podospora didyma TaxID=330526 RepID=A0AAE0P464_9PEZI|nr:hypothetical protein B0H63DRAFT_11699 [Podospora didyma]